VIGEHAGVVFEELVKDSFVRCHRQRFLPELERAPSKN
jgi:hypothetical protein